MTRAELLDIIARTQDVGGPEHEAAVREMKEKVHIAYLLRMQFEIDCENDRHVRDWKRCQQAH